MTEQNETETPLSAKQIKFAELLADPEDRRTRSDKIAEVGVSRSTAYRWLKDNDFLDYLNEQIDKYTDGHLSTAWRSLITQMKRGDTQAIKLFFELKGKYKQQIDVTTNEESINQMTPEEREKRRQELRQKLGDD